MSLLKIHQNSLALNKKKTIIVPTIIYDFKIRMTRHCAVVNNERKENLHQKKLTKHGKKSIKNLYLIKY